MDIGNRHSSRDQEKDVIKGCHRKTSGIYLRVVEKKDQAIRIDCRGMFKDKKQSIECSVFLRKEDIAILLFK